MKSQMDRDIDTHIVKSEEIEERNTKIKKINIKEIIKIIKTKDSIGISEREKKVNILNMKTGS